MIRTLFIVATALAVASAVSAAQIQAAPESAQASALSRAVTGSGVDASAEVSQFVPGMTVDDRTGVRLGEIAQSGQTADGTWGVVVTIDGEPYNLPASSLALSASSGHVVSALTKTEIKAAAKPKP